MHQKYIGKDSKILMKIKIKVVIKMYFFIHNAQKNNQKVYFKLNIIIIVCIVRLILIDYSFLNILYFILFWHCL
jgi:hypothetical protein